MLKISLSDKFVDSLWSYRGFQQIIKIYRWAAHIYKLFEECTYRMRKRKIGLWSILQAWLVGEGPCSLNNVQGTPDPWSWTEILIVDLLKSSKNWQPYCKMGLVGASSGCSQWRDVVQHWLLSSPNIPPCPLNSKQCKNRIVTMKIKI